MNLLELSKSERRRLRRSGQMSGRQMRKRLHVEKREAKQAALAKKKPRSRKKAAG